MLKFQCHKNSTLVAAHVGQVAPPSWHNPQPLLLVHSVRQVWQVRVWVRPSKWELLMCSFLPHNLFVEIEILSKNKNIMPYLAFSLSLWVYKQISKLGSSLNDQIGIIKLPMDIRIFHLYLSINTELFPDGKCIIFRAMENKYLEWDVAAYTWGWWVWMIWKKKRVIWHNY